VQVGAAIAVSRLAVAEVPPLTLAMLRYVIAFACLAPFAWGGLREWRAAQPLHGRVRDHAAIAILGIVQFGVLVALVNIGLQRTGAAEAALIFSLFPLFTLLLSASLGRDRLNAPLAGGVLLSIAGVAVALAPKLGLRTGAGWWGELAVFAAAVLGAVCSVLYRPYLRRYPTVPVSALAMLASVAFLACAAWGEDWPARVTGFSAVAWAATLFVGFSSAIGFFAWLYALKHESPARVTVFLGLNPPTAALVAWALLGESLHAALFAGLVLVTAGLWLATRGAPTPSR
jgi:drug/metabolite transporter (DMT)-like permease